MKKKIYLILAFILLVLSAKAEDKLYTEMNVEGNDTTLVLKYGEMPDGENIYSFPVNEKLRSQTKYLVIDESVKQYSPTSCCLLFHDMRNMVSVSGIENLNTSKVTTMMQMFEGCSSLTSIDLSALDLRNLEDTRYMFNGCTSLKSVKVNNDVSINKATYMFYECVSLESINLSRFNAVYGASIPTMFARCSNLKVAYLGNFIGNSVNGGTAYLASQMFADCSKLTTIYCNQTWHSIQNSHGVFSGCTSLKGAIEYDASKVNIDYANPKTGYFTKVDTFAIKIAGTSVTTCNSYDLTYIQGVTGTAIYNDATHTLTLKDASISSTSGECGIYCDNTIDTLYINIEGECNISCPDNTGINALAKCVKIQGGGILNIIGYDGIYMEKSASNKLWVTDGTQVYVDGARYGVRGREYTRRVLDGSTKTYRYTALQVDGEKTLLSVKGTTKCYQTLGSFTLSEGYKVTAPSNTAFYTTDLNGTEQYTFCKRALVKEKGSATTSLTFTPIVNTWVTIEDTRSYNIPGDVNGDGSITMADANAVVNYFLSTDKSGITNFDVTAADVNNDGGITMADANQIVNMFLGIGNDSHETETPDTKKAIDLGLSVKWATCNVGASEPWDYGDYFAWGETTGYAAGTTHVFNWSSYKYRTNSFITKYVFSWVDNTVYNDYPVLLPEDDAAAVNWGGTWRMPTEEELKDLWTKCQWTWQPAGNTKYNGVAGYEVTGTNGNSIFIPHAGYYDGEKKDYWTVLWSSTLYPANDESAWILWFSSGTTSCSNYAERYLGVSVRPVCP